jgi:diguanylate cyclase
LPISAGITTGQWRVAEAVDWRKRHLDALREMEHEERRWRGMEQILRRLVTRLCAVASGHERRLDAQLHSLAAAAQRDADENQLQSLYDALTATALALEGTRTQRLPIPGPADRPDPAVAPRWHQSCEAVAVLVDRLRQAEPRATDMDALASAAHDAMDDGALAQSLLRLGDLVAGQHALLVRERAEAVMTLAQVTERLNEMAHFLTGASAERERDHEDRQSMNISLLVQMNELSSEVQSRDDLPALRALVTERLDIVARNVRDFREREQSRFAEDAVRSERMCSRLAALEQESRELSRNLDLEKQRSRIDMLTRVSNRVSFDERFAEELARWKRFRRPVAVLVWDIDRFKSINDACGHRGGDAVLREVAVALSRGRRAVDFFARFGGEEFVSLLVGAELSDAMLAAEEMRGAVEALRFHFHGTPVRVTVSCGLTAIREGDTAESVFDRADAALYQAKNGGRNVCVAV